jgi:glutathione S-transferase
MAPKLGYWNIRGLGQPIRLLLAHAGQEVEEKRYNYGPPPTFDRSEWFNEKFTLGLDFPNLPYLIDGDVKLTQSAVIMRYLARKHGLEGQTEVEKRRADLTEQQLADLRSQFVGLCYNPNHEELKGDFLKSLPEKLKAFSDFLGENPFFAGQNVTYADFFVYEIFDALRVFAPDSLDATPNLKGFLDRVEALPNIAAYFKTDKYMKWPLNGDMAKFGSRHSKA